MALTFQQPVIVRRPNNPATELARNGLAGSELGFAEPSFNGNVMIQARGIMGNLPPAALDEAVLAEQPMNGGGHEVRIARPPRNTVSWRVELPPEPINGAWTSADVGAGDVKRLMDAISGRAGLWPEAGVWKVVIHPLPTAMAFMNHIRWHELQHVADHRWLAEQIIGPWDDWLETAHDKQLRFTGPNVFQIRAAITVPGNYATGSLRILRYWQSAIGQSGNLYHRTSKGAPPVFSVQGIVGTAQSQSGRRELHLAVHAGDPILGVINLGSPPHADFHLRPLGSPINGNEPEIGLPRQQEGARVIEALDVHTAAIGQAIQVQAEDDDDLGMVNLFGD